MEGNNFNASLLMVYIFISAISSPEVYRLSSLLLIIRER